MATLIQTQGHDFICSLNNAYKSILCHFYYKNIVSRVKTGSILRVTELLVVRYVY